MLKNVIGFNVSVETGPAVLRVGHMNTKTGGEGAGMAGLTQLQTGLRQVGSAPGLGSLLQLADDIGIEGKKASFSGIGATVDLDPWVFSAEVTKRKSESLYVTNLTSWYTTAGYRVGKFTPYLTLSGVRTNTITSVTAPSTVGYPASVQAAVPQLIGGVNQGVLNNITEKTLAIGTRWDAGKSYAVKAELARISVPAGSRGIFMNVAGGYFAKDTTVNVLSVGVDFVF